MIPLDYDALTAVAEADIAAVRAFVSDYANHEQWTRWERVEARLLSAAREAEGLREVILECRDAELLRRKKLRPGAPATTYCDARLARIDAALARTAPPADGGRA